MMIGSGGARTGLRDNRILHKSDYSEGQSNPASVGVVGGAIGSCLTRTGLRGDRILSDTDWRIGDRILRISDW